MCYSRVCIIRKKSSSICSGNFMRSSSRSTREVLHYIQGTYYYHSLTLHSLCYRTRFIFLQHIFITMHKNNRYCKKKIQKK